LEFDLRLAQLILASAFCGLEKDADSASGYSNLREVLDRVERYPESLKSGAAGTNRPVAPSLKAGPLVAGFDERRGNAAGEASLAEPRLTGALPSCVEPSRNWTVPVDWPRSTGSTLDLGIVVAAMRSTVSVKALEDAGLYLPSPE
jgi:hypothetical protein